jgi:hypothetical protein
MNRFARLLPFLAVFWGTSMYAQEIAFDAKVDRTTFAVGESIRLSLSLTNAQGNIAHPDLGGLSVVQGPFESSSFNMINGRASSTITRTYMLTATAPGDYTIGAATARVAGGTISTKPIKVHVDKGSGATSDHSLNEGQKRDRDLFVTIGLSKEKVYVGEQVVATYTLYSRYPNLELSDYDLPALNGFWAEEIDIGETNWQEGLRTVNGLQYRVAVLKKQLLFPQRSGTLKIEPLRISCVVNRSFFNRGSKVETQSNTVTVQALPLPGAAPQGFSGAVGDLRFEARTDRQSVKANEAIELTITITGTANLKLVEAPVIELPPDVEHYDPKLIDHISMTGAGMSGSRAFQYLLIPRHEGDFSFGPFAFSYFDVAQGAYRTLSAGPILVKVEPGTGGGAASIARPSKTDVQVLDQDIRFLRTDDPQLRPKDRYLFGSWAYALGMGTPALALLLFGIWRRRSAARSADIDGTRRRRAERIARKRMKEAHDALQRNERGPFYAAMTKALQGYLADRFTLGVAEMDESNLVERMSPAAGGEALAREATALIATCEMARFAPLEDRPRQQLYDQAVDLIQRIERS